MREWQPAVAQVRVPEFGGKIGSRGIYVKPWANYEK